MEVVFELNKISYKYDNHLALDCISLTFEKGKAYALLGENGCGKSTLLKLLNGLIIADKGSVVYRSKVLDGAYLKNRMKAKVFHQQVGFVFQNPDVQLFCSNVYEEVAYAPRQMGLEESEVERRVFDCLKMVDIEHLIHRDPIFLSDGEKKRVAIAAVLSANPQVLVLDEPLNGLDPRSKRFLLDLMIELKRANKTIICSTHDLKYWEPLFDQAIVMNRKKQVVRVDGYRSVVNDKTFLESLNIL